MSIVCVLCKIISKYSPEYTHKKAPQKPQNKEKPPQFEVVLLYLQLCPYLLEKFHRVINHKITTKTTHLSIARV